eukprot:6208134-Pleurochrysis_carterae.AAC.1
MYVSIVGAGLDPLTIMRLKVLIGGVSGGGVNVVHEGDHPKEHTARKPQPRSSPPLTSLPAMG